MCGVKFVLRDRFPKIAFLRQYIIFNNIMS